MRCSAARIGQFVVIDPGSDFFFLHIMPNGTKRKRSISPALDKLIGQMEDLSTDAVDAEVCKRFRLLLETNEINVNADVLKKFTANPQDTDLSVFGDDIRPFLRHFRFMHKRQLP
jgi:hypothetical protein